MNPAALVVDLETKPDPTMDQPDYWEWKKARSGDGPPSNWKDPVKIEGWYTEQEAKLRGRMALRPTTAIITVIGVQPWDHNKPTILKAAEASRAGEFDLLTRFAMLLEAEVPKPVPVVGWNIRRFDVPMMCGRLLIQGVDVPWWPRHRYDCVDLYDMVGEDGPLTEWMYAMGRGFKADEGQNPSLLSIDDQATHCLSDMIETRKIAERLECIWGRRNHQ